MKKNVIIIVAVAICILVLAIGLILISNEDNSTNNDNTNSDDKVEYIGIAYSDSKSYVWPSDELPKESGDPDSVTIKISLPKILLNTKDAQSINNKIYNKYKSSTDKLESDKVQIPPTNITISYKYTLKNDILFILIKDEELSSRKGIIEEITAYYYDVKNDKELSVSEICSLFNITLDKIDDSAKESIYAVMPNSDSFDVYYTQNSSCPSYACKDVKTVN